MAQLASVACRWGRLAAGMVTVVMVVAVVASVSCHVCEVGGGDGKEHVLRGWTKPLTPTPETVNPKPLHPKPLRYEP